MAHSSRTIDPGDPQDERVAALSLSAAYTWAYLPLVLDDDGRTKDQPAVINGRLWPLRADAHPTSATADDIAELVTAGLLCRYTVAAHTYLHDPAWRKRQSIDHPSRSDLPRCPDHDSPIDDLAATLGRFPDQFGQAFGNATSRIDPARIGAVVARMVEDVTFPVDPSKAAAYGQRIRDFLAGADPSSEPSSTISVSREPTGDDDTPPDDVWRDATDDLSGASSRNESQSPHAEHSSPEGEQSPPGGAPSSSPPDGEPRRDDGSTG